MGHDPLSDIHDVLFQDDIPIAYATYYTYQKWHPLTDEAKKDLSFLESKLQSNFNPISQSSDGTLWIIKNNIPEKGIEFWLYNRTSQELTELYTHPNIPNLSKTYPLVVSARDGKKIVCYLTLPQELDRSGKVDKPIPLVVIPHGGPFKARDYFGYSYWDQWLANRGYAVLSVNFRLSSGFGKEFVNAGNRQWGKKAHEDIIDAVQLCVDAHIADKDKLAILGVSYGGYEALASLTFTPDFFACAVAVCAPANLKAVLKKCPFYWEFPASTLSDKNIFFTRNAFFKSIGGDPDNEKDIPHLESCSPLNYVDKIKKPLLLIHGGNDPIIVVSESDHIFAKMKEKGLPAMYIFFPDEGHGVARLNNEICCLGYSEWLFAKILGGRCEPISKSEVERSSATIQYSGITPEEVQGK